MPPARKLSTHTGYPVPDRPIMKFTWYTGDWFDIFQAHVALIQADLTRAHAEDRLIVYVSCPISSRGGSHFQTNVEIVSFVTRRLTQQWGDRFFFLNPAAYQLESKVGTGLIMRHIDKINRETGRALTLEQLLRSATPTGGDYMRMWSRVLIEDRALRDPLHPQRADLNLGGLFDAYYFLAPSDVRDFFAHAGTGSLSAQIETYFARKDAMNPEFRQDFATTIDTSGRRRLLDLTHDLDMAIWQARRKEFFRYYTVRACGTYSLGCHDEWNILHRLNQERRATDDYGPGEEIAGFFGGHQLTFGDTEHLTMAGYEIASKRADRLAINHPGEVAWPTGLAIPEQDTPLGSNGRHPANSNF